MRILVLPADGTIKEVIRILFEKLKRKPYELSFEYDMPYTYSSDTIAYNNPESILRRINTDDYDAAIVVLDIDWDGAPEDPDKIRRDIKDRIRRNSRWSEDDIEVIVISPELEIWGWYDRDKVIKVLGIKDRERFKEIYDELSKRPDGKPARPKEAFQALKGIGRRPYGRRMRVILKELAEKVPQRVIENCEDPEFRRLIDFIKNRASH